ncbi:MAG TPA: insulinase family protein, partial [Oligoflexia bacterium]|nr:insulinase family protein [Oligoflexia bacterium]
QLYQGIYTMLYGKAGYGRPVIGFPRTVAACTAASLKSFWKKWYSPRLMTLVVCGNVDPIKVEKLVARTWARGGETNNAAIRPRRRQVEWRSGAGNGFVRPKNLLDVRPYDVSSVRWLAALPACSMRGADLPALDLATMILGHGDTSRLYDELFRKKGLVTSVGCSLWAQSAPGALMLDVETSVEQAGGIQRAVWSEVERFCKEGPTKDEFDRARMSIETDRVYSVQSMDGYANRIGFLKNVTGNVRFDLEYLASIRELSLEDIRATAKRYLIDARDNGELREFSLVPKSFDIKNITESTLVKKIDSKPNKRSSKKISQSAIERVTLGGQVELFLIPRRDLPIVSVQVCAMGGLRAENPTNSGIGNILADVWEQGPAGMSSMDFSKFLENHGARMDAFSGRNSLGASATMLTSRVDDVLPLFCDLLNQPKFDAQEIERSKAVALEDIRGLADDGGRLCGRRFSELMFGDHPYALSMTGNKESVQNLDRKVIVDHYRKTFFSGKKVIAVSGKFNSSDVVRVFEEKLETKKNENPGPDMKILHQSLSAARLVEEKKNREQSHVIVGYQGTTIGDNARYDLRVLQTILGGQSGRLFREIRDKRGFCYTVSPMSFEGIEPGYFGVYIGCDPSKRANAIDAIHTELDKVKTKKVSKAELNRAKEYIYGRNRMEMQMTASVALAVAFNALYGLPFDEHERLRENLSGVTEHTVQRLAARILTQPSVTSIVV